MLIPDKVDFKTKNISDTKRCLMATNGSVYQEDRIILKVYAPNNGAQTHGSKTDGIERRNRITTQ